jgi:hypothetical protein
VRITMKKSTKNAGLVVKTAISTEPTKAGLLVFSGLKAGGIATNHNHQLLKARRAGLLVSSGIKAGGIATNHNPQILTSKKAGLLVSSGIKAGGIATNHNAQLLRRF